MIKNLYSGAFYSNSVGVLSSKGKHNRPKKEIYKPPPPVMIRVKEHNNTKNER